VPEQWDTGSVADRDARPDVSSLLFPFDSGISTSGSLLRHIALSTYNNDGGEVDTVILSFKGRCQIEIVFCDSCARSTRL
jgi:hypothetical protein